MVFDDDLKSDIMSTLDFVEWLSLNYPDEMHKYQKEWGKPLIHLEYGDS